MKYLYLGILILCLLLAGCLWTVWEIARRTDAVARPLELALRALRSGDEAASRSYARSAWLAWTQNEGVLAALISHDHTNAVGEGFAALPWERGSAFGRGLSRLLESVRELAGMERVVWRNVF